MGGGGRSSGYQALKFLPPRTAHNSPITPHQRYKCPDPLLPKLTAPQGELDSSPLLPLDGNVGEWTKGKGSLASEAGAQPLPRQEKGGWTSTVSSSQECRGLWGGRASPLRPLTLEQPFSFAADNPRALRQLPGKLGGSLEEVSPHVADAVLIQDLGISAAQGEF